MPRRSYRVLPAATPFQRRCSTHVHLSPVVGSWVISSQSIDDHHRRGRLIQPKSAASAKAMGRSRVLWTPLRVCWCDLDILHQDSHAPRVIMRSSPMNCAVMLNGYPLLPCRPSRSPILEKSRHGGAVHEDDHALGVGVDLLRPASACPR